MTRPTGAGPGRTGRRRGWAGRRRPPARSASGSPPLGPVAEQWPPSPNATTTAAAAMARASLGLQTDHDRQPTGPGRSPRRSKTRASKPTGGSDGGSQMEQLVGGRGQLVDFGGAPGTVLQVGQSSHPVLAGEGAEGQFGQVGVDGGARRRQPLRTGPCPHRPRVDGVLVGLAHGRDLVARRGPFRSIGRPTVPPRRASRHVRPVTSWAPRPARGPTPRPAASAGPAGPGSSPYRGGRTRPG